MATRFHELPLDLFPDEARPYIARLNRELRDLFGLEGTILDPRKTRRSDLTIARTEKKQVDVTRIDRLAAEVVTSISENSATDLKGDVNFVSGTNISLTQVGQNITIAGTTTGVVTSVSANGGADVLGDVNLVDGSGIDITRAGQDFTFTANLTELDDTFLRLDTSNDPLTGSLDFGDNFADMANLATPANPGAGVRRLFTDSGSGQLSVRTSSGTTVSLEAGGTAQSTHIKAFIAGGDTLVVPTKNQVVVCEEYLIEGTGSLNLEGTAFLCVLAGAA